MQGVLDSGRVLAGAPAALGSGAAYSPNGGGSEKGGAEDGEEGSMMAALGSSMEVTEPRRWLRPRRRQRLWQARHGGAWPWRVEEERERDEGGERRGETDRRGK